MCIMYTHKSHLNKNVNKFHFVKFIHASLLPARALLTIASYLHIRVRAMGPESDETFKLAASSSGSHTQRTKRNKEIRPIYLSRSEPRAALKSKQGNRVGRRRAATIRLSFSHTLYIHHTRTCRVRYVYIYTHTKSSKQNALNTGVCSAVRDSFTSSEIPIE